MSHQLAYVIVTPYSLYKSRTGGILSRLITRTGLEPAAMRMFAPSAELAKEYSELVVSARDPQERKIVVAAARVAPSGNHIFVVGLDRDSLRACVALAKQLQQEVVTGQLAAVGSQPGRIHHDVVGEGHASQAVR